MNHSVGLGKMSKRGKRIEEIFEVMISIIMIIFAGVLVIDEMNKEMEEAKEFCKDKEGMWMLEGSRINCTAWNTGEIEAWSRHTLCGKSYPEVIQQMREMGAW